MTLYEMLDNTKYNSNVWIYTRNDYDQCFKVFKGTISEARSSGEDVWFHLMDKVEQYICGANSVLIYVTAEEPEKLVTVEGCGYDVGEYSCDINEQFKQWSKKYGDE